MEQEQMNWLREIERERQALAADNVELRQQRRLVLRSLAVTAALLVASVLILYWGA